MPLLDHCWYCSLRVAASVLAVYTSVAYLIAFIVDAWWIWEAEGLVPYVEFILTSGYLLNFILAVVLVRGISERKLSHLVIWMGGLIAMLVPEGVLVIFMSLNYWKIHTVYGLTEFTFWMCRLMVNCCSLVCIQSLYSTWKEENEVINSLRDLNKVSQVKNKIRRGSVSSDNVSILNSYVNPGYSSIVQYEKLPTPMVRRSNSVVSMRSERPPSNPGEARSEFDAAKFKPDGWHGEGGWPGATVWSRPVSRSMSLGDLRQQPPKLPPPPVPKPASNHGSLDRPRRPPQRSHSMADLMRNGAPRLHSAYFDNQPIPSYLLDPWTGRVVYVADPRMLVPVDPFLPTHQMSRVSLAESDDTHRIKDVAL